MVAEVLGAVASPHQLATDAGASILRAGGSAVDAAIATNAALAVVASYMCGLGGDAFWLIWSADTGRVEALNGSGRAASGATIEAARAAGLDEMPVRGPWTITVPGAIRSWGDAHARHGRLPWAELIGPAIGLASGFPASENWVATIEHAATVYGADGDWARSFRPEGRAWRTGETVRLSALESTLRALVAEGPDVAYTGALAARAATYLEASGSPLRAQDFALSQSDWVEPISTTYRGVTSVTHPPNSCGPIAMELLNVLDSFPPPPRGAFTAAGVADATWVHRGLEAARVGIAHRDAWLSDPAAMTPGALERMLDKASGREIAAALPERASTPPPSTLPMGGGTVYLCTADRWGGVVSLIESNYAGFGSGLVDPETGIAYQNRGAFFRLDPSHVNALAPRKRTVHTLTPGMLLRDGVPWIVHGSMGGEIQPQVFAQFVSAVVDGGMNVRDAVDAPRWAADNEAHLGPPSLSALESRYDAGVVRGLRELGHDVRIRDAFDSAMGHEHAIELRRDATGDITGFDAASDPRSEGGSVAL
ncbi:MAG: gamma-glutamyltransferase family protein [Candidatus Limnocylindrales bacterium]